MLDGAESHECIKACGVADMVGILAAQAVVSLSFG